MSACRTPYTVHAQAARQAYYWLTAHGAQPVKAAERTCSA